MHNMKSILITSTTVKRTQMLKRVRISVFLSLPIRHMGQDCKFASRQLSGTRKTILNNFSFKVKLCSVLLASETILYFSKVCCKVCIEHWHFHMECCAPFTKIR